MKVIEWQKDSQAFIAEISVLNTLYKNLNLKPKSLGSSRWCDI